MFEGQPFTQQETLDNLLQSQLSEPVNCQFFQMVANDAIEGSICEFGVATGETVNAIAEAFPQRTVWGFDSFEGLPEDWNATHPAGTFKRERLPKVLSNVKLVKGLFNETLTIDWEGYGEVVSFCHIDCDLYSSSKTIIDWLWKMVVPGSIILFDELYYTYAGDSYKDHEYKALLELLSLLRMRDLSLSFYGRRHNEAFAFKVITL